MSALFAVSVGVIAIFFEVVLTRWCSSRPDPSRQGGSMYSLTLAEETMLSTHNSHGRHIWSEE